MSQDAGFVVSGRNYGLVPMQGQATDAETQLARLEDFMNAGYDAEAAKRAREYYGEGVPIEHISEEDMSFFAGAAFARIKGVPNNPEAYWHAQKKDIPDVEREQMFELLGAELRQQVRSRWDERQARIKAVEESLGRMDVYVRGDEFGEAFSEQDLANVRGVMDAETMADAEAVRAWMRTYMLPLAGKDDAEEVLRTVDGLEDEFFEVIGTSPRRAEMAYNAMLHWAEGMKQSGKVGVADEFIVGVGKKISNWGKAAHLMAPAVAMAPVGNPDFPIMLSDEAMAGQQAELARRHEEYARHENARSILRAAINKSLELGDNVSWWKGAARTASQMAGDSSAYLLPGVGMYTGTADLLMGGATETVDRFALQGLSGDAAAGRAAIETGVQALVELTPWGRVGGKGFSAFTRRYFGEAIEKGTAGKLSRWVVRNTQNSTMRALVAEGTVSFVDEGILEPIAGGLMTYGAEQAADVLGIPHGQSREFTACFDELKALYTDPYQAAGLFLFTAGLTGAGAYGVRENVRYFAKHRKMWEAAGLTPEQVDRVMAADDRVELGGKLVREGWESDPAGMRERVLKANKDIAERGEVLVLTGEGALDAELENSELAPAYRAVWQEYQDKGLLPKVEAVGNNQFRITKEGVDITLDARGADAYLQHAIDEVDSIQTRELQQRLGKEHFIDLRAELADAVSTIAGGAAMRAAEAAGERTGVAVTDITKGLPEWLADGIVKRGQITLKDAQDVTEWAIGRIDGLVQEGMSPADARLTRASADGMARTLGDWSTFVRDFAHREQLAGLKAGTGAISISRTRNEQAVTFDGRLVLGQTIMTLPGNVRHQGAVEDVTESFADMMVQQRAQAIREANPDSSPAEAENAAWQELGEVVQRARAAVLKADAEAEIEEVKPGDKMSIIEALSTMATSRFVASRAVPGWMQGLTAALKGNLAAADSLAKVRAAYASVLQNDPSAVSELDAMLDKLGVYVQDTFREARVEAVDIQAWKHAHALVTARAESPAGSGGAAVSEALQAAQNNEDAISQHESAAPAVQDVSPAQQATEAAEILNGMVPGSNAPAGMQGVFVDDKCYYNAAGGFWCGMIDKHKLRDGTEQVKVGAKGKHGVIAGRELTGKFQQNVGAIYIWKRTNGELQVISGRHRFAKLMEDDSAQSCNAYVFEEDAEHDERWARMLDYENNMRDDQADEVTAATYVRETGLSDTELEVRGLMRNGTRCKRGALIGRFAREELWTRFINGAVKPMDAEVICNLTRSIRDQGRVEEIQRRCCMLLDEKKSWEYIGAMVQLMANKENVVMKQGLLDFGADFEADLARAAEWIERNIKAINESVSLLKQGRKLSGKKRAEAERLGIATATQEGTEQMLYDLEQLRAQFEMIGSYPVLVAAAQMWDGKTEVDPVGQYLERARAEREQVRAEGEMDVEEYLAEQARKEAAEAVPSLFSMEMEKRKLEDNQVKISNKAIVTFKDGVVRNKNSRVLRRDGREVWARFPEIPELKEAGFPEANVYMEVGSEQYGFIHIAYRHVAELEELYPGVPVPDAVEMFVDEVFSKLAKVNGSYSVKGRKKKVEADTPQYYRNDETKKKRVTLQLNKADNSEYYTFISAFEAKGDKEFEGAKKSKDGLTCAVTVELDGKAPGLPTGAMLNPSHARQQHSRRPDEDDNITPDSNVKAEDIDFEFLRKAKHPDVETGARTRGNGNFSASLTAVTPEMDERYMAAVKDGTFMKAPNGKPTRLTEHQWLQVRTGAFKGWFGEWERAAELTFDGSEYNNETCLKMLVEEAGTPFVNDETGIEAEINNRQRGKITSGKAQRKSRESGFSTGVHNYVAAHIRRLFKHAVHIGDYRDKNASDDILAIKRFVCPVRIKGVKAFAYMTVKELKQHGHKIYTLELDTIERLGGNLDEHFEEMLNPAPSEDIVARLKALSKTYFEDVSKVVDENGEPLVVYHGTVHGGFRVFDVDGRGKTEGAGAFFTSDKRVAEGYSANFHTGGVTPEVYACFLNIREPHEVDFNGNSWNRVPDRASGYFVHYDNGESEWFSNRADADFAVSGYDGKAKIEEDWEESPTLDDLAREVWEESPEVDGIIARNVVDTAVGASKAYPATDFIVASPNQIKSATDNRGTFDGNNPDITFSLVTQKMDARYMAAVERGDMDAAQRMVNEVARKRGYLPGSDYQGSEAFNGVAPSSNAYFDTADERYEAWQNGDFEGDISLADFVRRGMDPGELEWMVTSPGEYQRADKYKRESIEAIRKAKTSKQGKVTIYRAVPADVKEKSVRNGDWVTLSKAYAEYHISLQDWEKGRIIKQEVSIDDVWWDGNDVNEWGYDDGKEYAYRNTANNRKLLAPVTYDENGEVVPLSKRFNYRSADVSFSVIGPKAKTWDRYKHRAFTGRDDGMQRAEIDASGAKLKWEDLRGKNVTAYRRMVAGWDKLPEDVRKAVEAYAEEVYDWQDASKELDSVPESEVLEHINKIQKMGVAIKPKREEMRSLLNKLFVAHGGSAGAVLNMKSGELDELAMSLWGPYVESKVERMLDLRPLWNGGMRLADVIDYPELYEAYPELADVVVRYVGMETAYGRAIYGDGEREILINRNLEGEWEKIHSILLHEIQHHIQNIEGFAKGGNPSYARRLVDNRAAMGDADALALREHSDMELYHRIAGEIEARNVQARYGWSMDRREAIPFNSTLEYPGEALVTFSVQSVTADWKNTLHGYLNNPPLPGTPAHTHDMVVCPTPAVMQMVGAKGWDMVVTPGVLDKVMKGKHAVSVVALEQLPAALADPICIAVSDTPGCLEVVTELKEGQHNVLVAVQLSSRSSEKKEVKVNRIASMYGKERIASLLSHPMLYWDKAKARIWMQAYRLQLPAQVLPKRASGRKILKPADLVKYKFDTGLSFAMEKASLRALNLLTIRADERAGEQLIKDWQAACENWGRFGREDAGRLGNGAKMLGEMQALIGATKGVLPERYCRMGHLNGLMRWASIYAKMQQDGTLPQVGEIKGPIYQKFLDKLQQADELNRLQGMSEQEAQEAMALLAGERLDTAMLKVARECRRRLELFLKDREQERIEHIVEKAYPKRQNGQKWPRGKMAADAYRRMERARQYMNLPADEVAERINDAKRKLDALDATDADFERKEEELEEEISLLQTFGCWENMGFEQARRACGVMTEMVLLGRAKWKEKLQGTSKKSI